MMVSCSAEAGIQYTAGLPVQSLSSLEYWIARSSPRDDT